MQKMNKLAQNIKRHNVTQLTMPLHVPKVQIKHIISLKHSAFNFQFIRNSVLIQ